MDTLKKVVGMMVAVNTDSVYWIETLVVPPRRTDSAHASIANSEVLYVVIPDASYLSLTFLYPTILTASALITRTPRAILLTMLTSITIYL